MKWIQRVIIDDFQSHRTTELAFVQGFNVIVGPSDQGKTAIIRAIRWVLYNEPKGSDFIRVGSNRTKVTLIMNDGTIVSRERTSSRNRYSVAVPGLEEQIYEGFGHGVPEEVMNATGVRPVKIDESTQVNINIGMQLDAPFLLDSNGAIKAKAIGRINGVHILDYAHKTTSSELNSKQIEERRLLAEIEKREEQLKQFDDLDQWEKSLTSLERGLQQAEELERRIEWFKQKLLERKELDKKLRTAEEFINRLAPLDMAGEYWKSAEKAINHREKLLSFHKQLHETRFSLQAAEEWIRRTSSLEMAGGLLVQAISVLERGQAVERLQNTKRELNQERDLMNQIVHQTVSISQAEIGIRKLQDVLEKEQLLISFATKANEYQEVDRKIQLVLSKTKGLDQAQQLWEEWQEASRNYQILKGFVQKRGEWTTQLQLVAHYTQETEALPVADQQLQKVLELGKQLEVLRDAHYRSLAMVKEKRKLDAEIEEADMYLEAHAKQYYEQLKHLGRCPICLGEIEHHTVERIVAEIS
ncbi:AAA family ATPase [Ammoniphilus sp. CFH 90114]|uniref:AAA family ATPase n=1 Tax=Ammoniphilus sp. CFH 90114 TaxID=2493665 RepID=UPI00100DF1D3|nr:AAA family ATPase [Ammoniphilus sp. CFH 90114]RXT08096.1 hypothetical protein EIZ39_11845 [Ammoniphilus sp. CFH 90114]